MHKHDSRDVWGWAQSLMLLEEMRQCGFVADGMNCGATMSSLKKVGLWSVASVMLHEFRASLASLHVERIGRCLGDPFEQTVLVIARGLGVVAALKPPGLTSELVLERLEAQLGEPLTTVSRLDLQTSGILVAAVGVETSAAAYFIMAQFAGRFVKKQYLCLCDGQTLGHPGTQGELRAPLSRSHLMKDNYRVSLPTQGKDARTSYQELATFASADVQSKVALSDNRVFSLTLARPHTGRTHQIRVHFSHIGQPLVSDSTYNADRFEEDSAWCPRMFLHCRRITLCDLAGADFDAKAPLPADLRAAIEMLSNLAVAT